MLSRLLIATMTLTCVICVEEARAGKITVTGELRRVTAAEAADGAPAGGVVAQLFVTTDGDILSVNNVQIFHRRGGALFNVPPPFGSNIEPPPSDFVALRPSLTADSWITTPGPTQLLGTDLPGDGASIWGDLTDSGPQTHFQFAQFTQPNHTFGSANFRISIADPTNTETGIYTESYRVNFPEPGSGTLAAVGLVALTEIWRRRA